MMEKCKEKAVGYGKKARLDTIDTLRGISIILMIIYHAAFDIAFFGFFNGHTLFYAAEYAFSSSVLYLLQGIFSSIFIFISGISCSLSRSNLKRGAKLLVIALLLTAVTVLAGKEVAVYFGILHLLSISMLIYALFEMFSADFFQKIPSLIWLAAFFIFKFITENVNPDGVPLFLKILLFPLGFCENSSISADYFPILPWIFIFFFGASLGKYLPKAKDAKKIWHLKLPIITAAGRNTLIIYILHQPILLSLMWVIDRLIR